MKDWKETKYLKLNVTILMILLFAGESIANLIVG